MLSELERPSVGGLVMSDLDEARTRITMQEHDRKNVIQQILLQVGSVLMHADDALDQLEGNNVLGSAIVRTCNELAIGIGHLASQLENQSEGERRIVARACLDDIQRDLFLLDDDELENKNKSSNDDYKTNSKRVIATKEIAKLSEDDMMSTLQSVATLLRDIESTLRAIEQDEANEVADVALTVAHMFVITLRSAHASITPESIMESMDATRSPTYLVEPAPGIIEILDDDDFESNGIKEETAVVPAPTKNKSNDSTSLRKKKNHVDRVRILWPPLGPAVVQAFHWGKDAAAQQPILAAALGITLWPMAVMSAFIGTPLVVADHVAQNVYRNFQDTAFIEGMERSAAQLYQTGKLSLLFAKLVGRRSLHVFTLQMDRHGGPGKIVQDLGSMAIDRVTHPVETVGMAWNAMCWSASTLKDTLHGFQNSSTQEQEVLQ